ncbi:MAG TPA: hypothetical protein VGL42_15810 [Opitutaceae bacterium]|jgi:hypothetical protein
MRLPLVAADDWGHGAVAVSSRVSPDYKRERLPNGHFKTETYVVGKGGFYGSTIKDDSEDRMSFPYIVRTVAGPLRQQGYVPVNDKSRADLLLLVYWGTTNDQHQALSSMTTPGMPVGPATNFSVAPTGRGGGASVKAGARSTSADSVSGGLMLQEYTDRMSADAQTAGILGYEDWWSSVQQYQGTVWAYKMNDMLEELERPRYLVAILAYDYRLMRAHKGPKLVWETRYSVDMRGHDFDKDLPAMTLRAAAYFGQDSGGVLHDSLPEGHVEVGVPRVIGTVDH